jgi:hypothetical protein
MKHTELPSFPAAVSPKRAEGGNPVNPAFQGRQNRENKSRNKYKFKERVFSVFKNHHPYPAPHASENFSLQEQTP